jgi:hypothetical protein
LRGRYCSDELAISVVVSSALSRSLQTRDDPVTTLAALQSLIAQGESETLELKRSTADPSALAKRSARS